MIGSEEKFEMLTRQLFEATREGNIKKLIGILNLGINVNTQNKFGQTPILLAISYNDLPMVEKLAELGADLEIKDNYGRTPIFLAALCNNLLMVEKLAELGANLEIKDNYKQTPVFLAALCNNLLMVEKLADLGADLETKDKYGHTILSKIISKRNPYKKMSEEEQLLMIELLIKHGAKLTTRSYDALPIHKAIQAGCSLNIIKILLTKETINEKNCLGRTPLHLATLTRRADIVLLLKNSNVDIDARENCKQNTPLMLAVSKGYADIAVLLLAYGANPSLKNIDGQTFFDLASSEEMKSLALDVMHPLSTDTEFENKSIAQPSPSNNHSSVKHQILENKLQSTRLILSDLKSIHNMLPNPDLLTPSVYSMPQLRMSDVSLPELSTPDASQHSVLAVGSPSPCSSLSGISQYEYTSSSGSGISAASQRRNISPLRSITCESTGSSIDSFSPSGSYAVDTKRRKLSYTLL